MSHYGLPRDGVGSWGRSPQETEQALKQQQQLAKGARDAPLTARELLAAYQRRQQLLGH